MNDMEIKDRPVNMPCSDPEGCKHFKAEIQLNNRIKELETALKEWRDKADSELNINAGLHTENAHLQNRIEELEEIYLGQIRIIARSRLTYKERVERMVAIAEQALKGKPHECKTCWYSCEVKNISECPLILKAKETTKTVETQVICGLVDCLQRNTKGECGHTSIHFQPCSDSANVAACSEYTE